MNQIIEGIKKRRSCRNYQSTQVSDEDLKEILECGLLAPSGMDQQGIHFTVIQDAQIIAGSLALGYSNEKVKERVINKERITIVK